MRIGRVPGWLVAVALAVCLLSSTACVAVLRGVVREVADKHPGSEPPGLAARPRGVVAASAYQWAPTPDWTLYRFGHPFVLTRSLFYGSAPDGGLCQAVPLGMAQVLRVPNGAETTSVARMGPFDLRFMGGLWPIESTLIRDRQAYSAYLLASGARLGQGGSCGPSFFVDLRLGDGGDDPVIVLR